MLEKKPTSRQLQADKTRTEIYNIAVSLMEKQGFANTTIQEISERAGVSIGTFYHYFRSKEDIFLDLFKKADEYFENTVAPKLAQAAAEGSPAEELIVLYFRYYAKFNLKRGIGNISQLYNTKNKLFIKKGRYMQVLLSELISKGQEGRELSSDMSPDVAAANLFIASRGVIYDWCIHEGSYNLEQKMESYMRLLVKILKQSC
jgi:AcrR family transcriptional regulator